MSEKKRVRRFLLPGLGLGLLIALFCLLPRIPQARLQHYLQAQFSQILPWPCQMQDVRIKLLPRPALAVQAFVCNSSAFNLQVDTLELDLSPLSLLTFSPRIKALRLLGGQAAIPFAWLTSEAAGSLLPRRLLLRLLHSAESGDAGFSGLITVQDGACTLTGVPGCKAPLRLTHIESEWSLKAQDQSKNFLLAGELNGGECTLKANWYKVEMPPASEKSAPPAEGSDAGDRLALSLQCKGLSLLPSEALALNLRDNRWLADFNRADLALDIDGNPDGGLRFSGRFAASEHHFSRLTANPEAAQPWSQGALQANFSGFFQRRDGYLNIKSISLEYPEKASLFTRGLIRFREPFFVNLVNHIKVADLTRTMSAWPPLALPEYQVEGSLEGDFKLIGNPFSAPVLELKLQAEKIAVRAEAAPAASAAVPADDNLVMASAATFMPSEKPGGVAAGPGLEVSPWSVFRERGENLLWRLAAWGWIVKSDCRIETLLWNAISLREFTLVAEKNLLQLEIERLAARFGSQGQVRLSLILDELLQIPRWQASLVAEKFDLKPFEKTLALTGVLDASLVGGGRLRVAGQESGGLNLKGKWQLSQGRFFGQPLFEALQHFLEQEGSSLWSLGAGAFSRSSGEFSWRDKVLRLDDFAMTFSDKSLQAQGRFFTDPEQLDFRGKLNSREKVLVGFHLSGVLAAPKFTND
ncbi:MAG: hypothetical protein JXR80_09360 [Deltaproteobacteria bacterium]|nr:hypothetical protein [Deltaproteobacteria bacterium]